MDKACRTSMCQALLHRGEMPSTSGCKTLGAKTLEASPWCPAGREAGLCGVSDHSFSPGYCRHCCMCSISLRGLLARREKSWLHLCIPTRTSWILKDFLKPSIKTWKKKKKVVKNHWVSFKFIGTADGKGLVNFLFILLTLTSKLLSLFSSPWHYSSWCAWEVEPLLICSLQSVPKCGWQSAMAQHPNPRWQLLWRDTTTVSLCSSPASSGSHADISSALFTALIPRGRK